MISIARRRAFSRLAALAAAFGLVAVPPAARADGASYNDAGMHFDAPAGWESLPTGSPDPTGNEDDDAPTLLAAFVKHKGERDQNDITISVPRFAGTVAAFDVQHMADVRKRSGDTYFSKNEPTTLPNGMPAYYLKENAGSEAGRYVDTIEYLVCDGTRSIAVAYTGREGTFDDAAAKAALASLYVVAYPAGRK